MITIIPFKYEHALQIENPDSKEYHEAMKRHEQDATALTLMIGDDIIACGGVMILSEGVAEIWTLQSPLVEKHPIEFHKFMLQWRDIFQKKFNLVRMQASVQADVEKHIKWIEMLGFKREGCMRKYYGGKDYYMYARITE